MSNDGLFFKSVGKVHARYGTLWVAIALQGAFTLVHLVLGSVLDLMQLATLFDWLAFTICGLGLFVLRRTRPDWPRPYKATGYPVLPAIFLALSAFVFVMHVPYAQWEAIKRGIVVFVVGLLLFLFFRRRRGSDDPRSTHDVLERTFE
jgi:APA family basic amino acid/polyamine antiporter